MANNLAANPLVVDTAMTASLKNFKGPAYVPNGRFLVKRVLWVNFQTNADTFSIDDGASTNPSVIAAGKAVTADLGIPQQIPCDVEVADLKVTQISSGTLYIYLKPID